MNTNQFQFKRKFPEGFPYIIAGPCSVESENQIHSTVKELSLLKVNLVRGGIWKPRTRPDSFHGVGTEGLKWLKEAGNENDLPVAIEVASTEHVNQALNAGIDVLWIGARTTVNPFMVQEIADALKGTDIPVLVKNPVNPDLGLWIGAIERINRAGITNIAAVHRGFSGFEKSKYRNVPNWQIPIELKRQFTTLPLFCDPSHISGTKNFIHSIAQTALDLDYDGLMIETHINPAAAKSDVEQQLTPEELSLLLNTILIRNHSVQDVVVQNMLEELRGRIDDIDEQILVMLAERMSVAREIGFYKKENNMTILQVERWNEILRTRGESGQNKELASAFIKQLYLLIHDESIRQQKVIMNTDEIIKNK